MTGQDKGRITADGEVMDADDETIARVREAFARDLIVKDDEVVDELGGACFDGVCTVGPSDPQHNAMVLRNLGALTGLRPERGEDAAPENGPDGAK
jgi:hypothetical protein